MRTVSSCSVCRYDNPPVAVASKLMLGRSRKKRCIPSPSGLACQLCASKGLQCNAPTVARGSPDIPRPLTRIAPSSQSSVSASECEDITQIVDRDEALRDELIEIYFRVIHYKQHLLFHQTSFVHNQKQGLVARYLLFSIFALAAR